MIRIYPHSDQIVVKATDNAFANGSIAVQLAGLGRDLRIIDNTGQCVGTVRLDAPPAPRKNPAAATCVHRGAETREVECKSCGGNVRIKLFACAIGGECHLSKKAVAGATACVGCLDFQPPVGANHE